ncbi:hypothetical protein QSI_2832 [Clostridioides difficile P28]|nr:hypothetical protein QSI_2832 [Clostridioides difficile P28]
MNSISMKHAYRVSIKTEFLPPVVGGNVHMQSKSWLFAGFSIREFHICFIYLCYY